MTRFRTYRRAPLVVVAAAMVALFTAVAAATATDAAAPEEIAYVKVFRDGRIALHATDPASGRTRKVAAWQDDSAYLIGRVWKDPVLGEYLFLARWSPDGRRILHFREPAGGPVSGPHASGPWVVDRDGARPHPLAGWFEPAWSADGRRVVYRVQVGLSNHDLRLVGARGGRSTPLTVGVGDDLSPAWSPTGGLIAFTRDRNLWVVRPDGRGERQVTDGRDVAHPAWAPDGSALVFVGGRGLDLFTVRVDGTGLRRIAAGAGDYRFPTWSADGAWIAAVLVRDRRRSVVVMRPDGSDLHRISPPRGSGHGAPSWSRHGSRLALVSTDVRGRNSIWVVDVETDEARRVTPWTGGLTPELRPRLFSPTWSPPGAA